MTKLISKDTYVFAEGELIMNINDQANQKLKQGIKVINGSIGMLFDEEKKLASFDIVDETLKSNVDENSKKYDSISGNISYEKAVENWLFSDVNFDKVYVNLTATMGATGALANVCRCYGESGQDILVPSIRWGNYDSICLQARCNPVSYELFDEKENFNISSFKEKVLESCKKFNRALVIINDPCENPTGYSMTENEWDEVLSFCRELSNDYPIVLVDDIAYVNFKSESYTPIFQKFADNVKENFLITIAFSASKTLQIYGLRGGAIISIASDKDTSEEFKHATQTFCRTIWSSPNHMATNTMAKVFSDANLVTEMKDKLSYYREMVKARSDIFVKEAKEEKLDYYPYLGGFFILVKCNDNKKVAEKLTKKNIFIVPMCGGLRISIASLTKDETKGLAKAIKECL